MEVGSRKLVHVNVTAHPTSSWTIQQLREAIPSDHEYRWLIRDRSGIFSVDLDRSVEAFGVAVLKTPVRAPNANAFLRTADREPTARVSGLAHSRQ
jgi:putative transposase